MTETKWDYKWKPQVTPLSGGWMVYPRQGPTRAENWSFRDEFPKSEKRLKKSVERCQAWCDRENRREAYSRQVLERLQIG